MTRIVAYGDAIAAGLAKIHPHLVNLAAPGRGFVSNNLAPIQPIQPEDTVIVSIGWSDAAALFSPNPVIPFAVYERRYLARLHEITSRNSRAPVILLGMEPLTRPYPGLSNPLLLPMNQLLEKLARRAEISYLDLAAHPIGHRAIDGLLYQPDGYRLLLARCGHLGNGLSLSPQLGTMISMRPAL